MDESDAKRRVIKIQDLMVPAWAKISILRRACVCTSNADKCPFGGNLACLQTRLSENQIFPPDCKEYLKELHSESIKTVWKVAEIYAEDISLTDTLTPALQRFLDYEKAKKFQK